MSQHSFSTLLFLAYPGRHLLALVMDSDDRENPFFRSPIGSSPQRILDIGTGKGTWAMCVHLCLFIFDSADSIYVAMLPICFLVVRFLALPLVILYN